MTQRCARLLRNALFRFVVSLRSGSVVFSARLGSGQVRLEALKYVRGQSSNTCAEHRVHTYVHTYILYIDTYRHIDFLVPCVHPLSLEEGNGSLAAKRMKKKEEEPFQDTACRPISAIDHFHPESHTRVRVRVRPRR